MMRLSMIQRVDATVGPERSSPIAEAILSNWAYDPASIKWFRSSANFIYQFRDHGQTRFLRFIDASERAKEQIEEETRLLVWLTNVGIPVAEPVESKFGNLVETVETNYGTFHAVVFIGLQGQQLDIDDLSDLQYRSWGASLGQLHSALRGYEPLVNVRRSWRDHMASVEEQIGHDQQALHREWKRIYDWADSLPVNHENFGLIHYDFELDNLCWNDGHVQALDFDDCAYYWYVADIAHALRDLFDEHVDCVDCEHPLFQAFVDGYAEHAPIDKACFQQIPMFLRMHKLVTYAKLIRAMHVPVDDLPSWLQPLQRKLSNWVTSYRLSLE